MLSILKSVLYFFRVITHLKGHYHLARVLKPFREKNLIDKSTGFVYSKKYLATSLKVKNRLRIILFHYTFIKEVFTKSSLEKIFTSGLKCWAEDHNGLHFNVLLKFSGKQEYEGALSLIFQIYNRPVYKLSFTFGSGIDFGCPADTVIYISRLQGERSQYHSIKKASKIFGNNTPCAILLKILEIIGTSLNIKTIVGVSNKHQISINKRGVQILCGDYNKVWEKHGGIADDRGLFYYMPCPFNKKPIHLVKPKLRQRCLAKRKRLEDVYNKALIYVSSFIAAADNEINNPRIISRIDHSSNSYFLIHS